MRVKCFFQISIAISALAVHVSKEDWGSNGIINWIKEEMNSFPEHIASFLELLTVLPQVLLNNLYPFPIFLSFIIFILTFLAFLVDSYLIFFTKGEN